MIKYVKCLFSKMMDGWIHACMGKWMHGWVGGKKIPQITQRERSYCFHLRLFYSQNLEESWANRHSVKLS